MISTNAKRAAFNIAVAKIAIPQLAYTDYKTAQDNYQFLLTRDTLTGLGFSPKKASSMAGSESGSARLRLAKLDNQI